jgi:hypothetical protein
VNPLFKPYAVLPIQTESLFKLLEGSGGRVTLKMCIKKNKKTYIPTKLIKTEFVAKPTTMPNIPMHANRGDNAETNSFKNHNTGAGQCNGRISKMLITALIPVNTIATICKIEFMTNSGYTATADIGSLRLSTLYNLKYPDIEIEEMTLVNN